MMQGCQLFGPGPARGGCQAVWFNPGTEILDSWQLFGLVDNSVQPFHIIHDSVWFSLMLQLSLLSTTVIFGPDLP